jgi:glycerol-3-phosphate O-acyltransferase
MPLRKLKRVAKIVDAAMRDAARAQATGPAFRENQQKDRRGELSKFKTVQHALADRARIEKSKTTKAKAKTKKS